MYTLLSSVMVVVLSALPLAALYLTKLIIDGGDRPCGIATVGRI